MRSGLGRTRPVVAERGVVLGDEGRDARAAVPAGGAEPWDGAQLVEEGVELGDVGPKMLSRGMTRTTSYRVTRRTYAPWPVTWRGSTASS